MYGHAHIFEVVGDHLFLFVVKVGIGECLFEVLSLSGTIELVDHLVGGVVAATCHSQGYQGSKEDDGFLVLDGSKVNDMTIDEISTAVNEKLQDSKVYLSFDIDCLDPAYAPGTGTPVVGGMSTDKIMKILRALKDLDIVGMDIVEVSPAYDHGDITSLAAASIALEMLYMEGYKRM